MLKQLPFPQSLTHYNCICTNKPSESNGHPINLGDPQLHTYCEDCLVWLQPQLPYLSMWSCRLIRSAVCIRLGSKGQMICWTLFGSLPGAMPCWWVLTRTKQLSMAATTLAIWLCTCMRKVLAIPRSCVEWPLLSDGLFCMCTVADDSKRGTKDSAKQNNANYSRKMIRDGAMYM